MAEERKKLTAQDVAAILQRDNPTKRLAIYENGAAVAIWHDRLPGWFAFVALLTTGEWAKDPAVQVDGRPVYEQSKWVPYDGTKGGA